MLNRIAILLAACLVACAVAEFTATDMHSLARLGDYAISSSNQAVYTVSQWVCSSHYFSPLLTVLLYAPRMLYAE